MTNLYCQISNNNDFFSVNSPFNKNSILHHGSHIYSSNSITIDKQDHFTKFTQLTDTKSYVSVTGCVFEHILTATNLTNCEKLYYLLADSLSLIRKNKGESRSCALPAHIWANRLGCSRSLIFTMQKSLVKKGYFIINKDFDKIGRNENNLITPTLPNSVFNHLNKKFPDRAGDHLPYNPLSEYKRAYFDRTKLFINLNYNLLKIITRNEDTNPRQKILWLGFYTRCYKNYMLSIKKGFNVNKYSYDNDSSFSFICSYRELAELYSCSTKHLSKSIRALEKLGFIKCENFYIRKKCNDNNDSISDDDDSISSDYHNSNSNSNKKIQERRDQSLWKITLSLPKTCILELEKVKDRSNLKLKDITAEMVAINNIADLKLIEDYLILGGIKFNLNLEQSSLLKSVIEGNSNDHNYGADVVDCKGDIDISPSPSHASCAESYIDSVMEELDVEVVGKLDDKLEESSKIDDSKFLSDELETLSTSSYLEELEKKIEKKDGIKSDPHVAKSRLLYNKDLILNNKDLKSNLGLKPKVLFNEFLKRFRRNGSVENIGDQKKEKDFNICSELIREELKLLPKDKADKARKFAYSLVSKGLANGYAASLGKHELAKQLIYHIATWKPTKLGLISRDCEIDVALSIAWKKIIAGTWKAPLELAKAEILQHEFMSYKEKYQKSGILSNDAKTLEIEVNKLLGGRFTSLIDEITKSKDIGNAGRLMLDNQNDDRHVHRRNTTNENDMTDKAISDNSTIYLHHNETNVKITNLEDNPLKSFKTNETKDIINNDIEDYIDNKQNKQGYSFDLELERINPSTLDLSSLSEEQRHLKINTSNDSDLVSFETMNNQQFFGELRMIERTEDGDFVMTLKHCNLNKVIMENNNYTKNEMNMLK